MKGFFDKEEYSEQDLKSLVNDEIEESLNLDYKSARSLDKSDGKKRELVKDISAFANSDGGIIIFGIEEVNHKPGEFSFVDGSVFTNEWLENVIDSNIQPRINSLLIYPIRINNQLDKTIYLVKIPESLNAPHMSADKKYYRRFNLKSVPMEEYEVRNLYNRNTHAEMGFDSVWSKQLEEEYNENETHVFKKEIFVHIKNISDTLEKHCKIEGLIKGADNLGVRFSFYRDSNVGQRFSKDKNTIITAFNESPIFPGEEIPILRFELSVNKEHLEEFRKNAILELTLFDSSAIKSTEYDFAELMKTKNL